MNDPDPDPNGEGWQIVRPCCGAQGVLKRPYNAVLIHHKPECPRWVASPCAPTAEVGQ